MTEKKVQICQDIIKRIQTILNRNNIEGMEAKVSQMDLDRENVKYYEQYNKMIKLFYKIFAQSNERKRQVDVLVDLCNNVITYEPDTISIKINSLGDFFGFSVYRRTIENSLKKLRSQSYQIMQIEKITKNPSNTNPRQSVVEKIQTLKQQKNQMADEKKRLQDQIKKLKQKNTSFEPQMKKWGTVMTNLAAYQLQYVRHFSKNLDEQNATKINDFVNELENAVQKSKSIVEKLANLSGKKQNGHYAIKLTNILNTIEGQLTFLESDKLKTLEVYKNFYLFYKETEIFQQIHHSLYKKMYQSNMKQKIDEEIEESKKVNKQLQKRFAYYRAEYLKSHTNQKQFDELKRNYQELGSEIMMSITSTNFNFSQPKNYNQKVLLEQIGKLRGIQQEKRGNKIYRPVQKQNEDAKQMKQRLEKEIEFKENQLVLYVQQFTRIEQELRRASSEITALKRSIERMEKENSESISKKTEEIQAEKQIVWQLSNQIENKDRQLLSMWNQQSQIQQKDKEINRLQRLERQLRQQINRLNYKFQDNSTQAQSQAKLTSKKPRQIDEKQKGQILTRSKLKLSETEELVNIKKLEEIKAENKEKDGIIEQMLTQKKNQSETKDKLQKEISALKRQIEDKTKNMINKEAEVNEKNKQINSLKQLVKQLTENQNKEIIQLNSLRTQLRSTKIRNDSLSEELSSLKVRMQNDSERFRVKIKQLEDRIQSSTKVYEQMMQNLKNQQQEISQKDIEIKRLRQIQELMERKSNQIKQLSDQVFRNSRLLDKTKNSKSQNDLEKQQMKEAIQGLRKTLQQKQGQVQLLKSEVDECNFNIGSYKRQNNEMQEQIKLITNSNENLNNQLWRHRARSKVLKQRLIPIRQSIQKLYSQINSNSKECDQQAKILYETIQNWKQEIESKIYEHFQNAQKKHQTQLAQIEQYLKKQIARIQQQRDSFQTELINIRKETLEKQYKCPFDQQSWLSRPQQKILQQKIISELQFIGQASFQSARLLYRYSPERKLTWSAFVGRPNILLVLITRNGQRIVGYTSTPFADKIESKLSGENDRGFLMCRKPIGEDVRVFHLQKGKRSNQFISENIAFGKSEIRIRFGEGILQSNFGLSGAHYAHGGMKAHQFLGESKGFKTELQDYQIYEICFKQQHQKSETRSIITTITNESRDSKLSSSSRDNRDYNKQLSEKTRLLEEQIKKNRATEASLQDQRKKVALQQKQLYLKIKELAQSQSERKRGLDELKKAEQKILDLTNQYEKNKQQLLRLQKAHQQLSKSQIRQRSSPMVNQSGIRREKLSEEKKLQAVIQQLRQQIQKQKSQIQELTNENIQLADLKSKIYEYQHNIEQLNQKILELEGKETNSGDIKEQSRFANQSPNQLEHHLSQAKQKNILLEQQNKKYSLQVLSLKDTIKQLKREYELYEKKIKSLERLSEGGYRQIRHLFLGDLFSDDHDQEKMILLKHIEAYIKRRIKKTRLLYKWDQNIKNINFHKYIDGVKSLACVARTKTGKVIAGYYPQTVSQSEAMDKGGLLISVWNDQRFLLCEQRKGDKKSNRGMVYDKYYAIFGNAEVRIKSGQCKIFSNFGIMNSFYDNRKKKVGDFLGQGENRQIELITYEFYEVVFGESVEKEQQMRRQDNE